MPIQVQVFNPLEHKHYQLAKTQSEYDEDAKRQMAIDNNRMAGQGAIATMHEANQNNRTNAAIMERRRQDATAQGNTEFEQDRALNLDQAKIAQQGIDNDYRERAFSANQANQNAQLGLSYSRDARDQAQFEQAQQDRRQAEELKQIPLSMAKFGHYLSTAEPDKDGMVDVTDQKDNIKTMVGGFGDQDYKRITAQNVDGKTKLFGYTDDNKAVPLTRNGNPVAISNQVLQQQALFASGGDAKTAKAQAELEQTQLENKQKQAELDYMVKHGVKMGAAGQEKQNVTISTNQIGGSNILNKDEGTLTVTDPKGKIISTTKIPGVGAANQAAQGVDIQQSPTPQKMTAQQAYDAALSSGDKGRAERIKQMAMQRGDWQ